MAFGLKGLPAFIMGLVVLGMIGAVGVIVLSKFNDIAEANNYTQAGDFLSNVLEGFGTIGTFIGVIVIAAVGFIVISIVSGGGE